MVINRDFYRGYKKESYFTWYENKLSTWYEDSANTVINNGDKPSKHGSWNKKRWVEKPAPMEENAERWMLRIVQGSNFLWKSMRLTFYIEFGFQNGYLITFCTNFPWRFPHRTLGSTPFCLNIPSDWPSKIRARGLDLSSHVFFSNRTSIWPSIHGHLLGIVFVTSGTLFFGVPHIQILEAHSPAAQSIKIPCIQPPLSRFGGDEVGCLTNLRRNSVGKSDMFIIAISAFRRVYASFKSNFALENWWRTLVSNYNPSRLRIHSKFWLREPHFGVQLDLSMVSKSRY